MDGGYLIGSIKTEDETLLKSAENIKEVITKVCNIIGIDIVGEKYHIFKNPSGITYCFILSQSHFIIHTWPEEFKIFFDVFTCGKRLDKEKFVEALSKEFKGDVIEIKEIEYK